MIPFLLLLFSLKKQTNKPKQNISRLLFRHVSGLSVEPGTFWIRFAQADSKALRFRFTNKRRERHFLKSGACADGRGICHISAMDKLFDASKSTTWPWRRREEEGLWTLASRPCGFYWRSTKPSRVHKRRLDFAQWQLWMGGTIFCHFFCSLRHYRQDLKSESFCICGRFLFYLFIFYL